MRRAIAMIATVAAVSALALVLAWPVAARGMGWGQRAVPGVLNTTPASATITMQQARDRVSQYLTQLGLSNLRVGEVMQFSNNFYAEVLDPVTGNGAFEVLVSLDGQAVSPEPGPTMMWNTTYSPMFGTDGAALRQGMMDQTRGYGMMQGRGGSMMDGLGMMGSGGQGHGMMGNGGAMLGSSFCQSGSGMGYYPNSGSPLPEPLTADTALARAQSWLDQNRSGVTAVDPTAFPGYFTFETQQGGKIVGMLSVQPTTGAIWEHTWHGTFVAIDSGPN